MFAVVLALSYSHAGALHADFLWLRLFKEGMKDRKMRSLL